MLMGCLFANAALAQTPSLTQTLNGGATRQPATYSSQPAPVATKINSIPPTQLLARKQYNENLTVSYSTVYQFGTVFLAGDFYKISQAVSEEADGWPLLIEGAVKSTLQDMARKAGFKNENIFLTTDNINKNIATTRASPVWQDLFKTADALRNVDTKTPTFKEAGGFSTGLQITASSPLIDPNGTPSYNRVITSFPFTVR